MLVLPMRSPTPSPTRHLDTLSPPSRSKRDESPQTSELRQRVAGAMLSVMPSSRPPTPKRPKLSLQTAIPSVSTSQGRRPSLNLATADLESPTGRNTYANTRDAPPPTPSSTIKPHIDFPAPALSIPETGAPPATLARSEQVSPFAHEDPYVLPIGTRSILRNSPLSKRHLSGVSTRTPRRIFPPVKRVGFEENPVEVIPTPVIETLEEGADSEPQPHEAREERKAAIEAEDGHASAGSRRSKREWIWRPMPEDVLIGKGNEHAPTGGDKRPEAEGLSPDDAMENHDFCE